MVVGPPHQVYRMYQSNLKFYEFRLCGVEHTVQIDECLIAKRKYQRDKRDNLSHFSEKILKNRRFSKILD